MVRKIITRNPKMMKIILLLITGYKPGFTASTIYHMMSTQHSVDCILTNVIIEIPMLSKLKSLLIHSPP